MVKKEVFSTRLQSLATFARAISHPARLAILEYLAETRTCISGDISTHLPLSRSTVSQHLTELKQLGLIHGEVDGLRVNYCLCTSTLSAYLEDFERFFESIKSADILCDREFEDGSDAK